MLSDKDIDSAAVVLAETFDDLIVTEVEGPKALAADELAEVLRAKGANVVDVDVAIPSAYKKASRLAGGRCHVRNWFFVFSWRSSRDAAGGA